MAEFSDYPHLTEFDKSRSKPLKKAIFEISQILGSGVVNPVPYDTAWVARIPEINKPTPAFPQSLQWLRDHQTQDGSWGTEYPYSLQSRILNTFSAVLALSQWNYKHDEDRIKKGVQALELIAQSLPKEETELNAFEMILSSLVDDARKLKLDLTYDLFEWYSKVGKYALKNSEKEFMSNKPNKYWSLLEAAGSMDLMLSSYRPVIAQYGLIAAQPSTTAFLLRYARLRGENFPEAEWVFEKVCAENQGGVPHIMPLDNFEISHGLDFLFKAGINPTVNCKYVAIRPMIDSLLRRMDSKHRIGFSSYWPIADDECTANSLNIIRQASGKDRKGSDMLKSHDDINYSCKAFQLGNETRIKSIRNISLYHSILQNVFAISKHDLSKLNQIEHIIGNSQNSDGGWGAKCPSSVEETAYMCIAIFRIIQAKNQVLNAINFPKLVKFMDSMDIIPRSESFWCYKVICGSTVLTETVITAAKQVIFQIQRLCMFTKVINHNRLDFYDVKFGYDDGDQLAYRNIIPMLRADVRTQDIEVSKNHIEDICKSILQLEELDAQIKKLIDFSLNTTYFIYDFKMTIHDRVEIVLLLLILTLIDDTIDSPSLENAQMKELQEALEIAVKILRGHHEKHNLLPSLNIARIELIWRWCFYYRDTKEINFCNAEAFAKILEQWSFRAHYQKCKVQCCDIKLTPKGYLEISKLDSLLIETACFIRLKQDKTTGSIDFPNDALFRKYCECASKAARLFGDVLSVFKDMKLCQSDNYCTLLMEEYGISLPDAMAKTCKKANKEFMKMYALKELMLKRNNVNSAQINLIMGSIERMIKRGVAWALQTSRYQVGQTFSFRKVHYKNEDLKFTWNLCFNEN